MFWCHVDKSCSFVLQGLKANHILICDAIEQGITVITKLRDFLVGSAHVRSQATVHAFMHAAHAVCMRAEDIDTRFKERA